MYLHNLLLLIPDRSKETILPSYPSHYDLNVIDNRLRSNSHYCLKPRTVKSGTRTICQSSVEI